MHGICTECLLARGKISLTKRQFKFLLSKLIHLHKYIELARILSVFRDNQQAKNQADH